MEVELVIEKLFRIENEQNQKSIKEIINKVYNDFFNLCEEFIAEISQELDEELNESIHIGLIDHVHLAVKRILTDNSIKNDFIKIIKKNIDYIIKLQKIHQKF